jgi:hypothetical protein
MDNITGRNICRKIAKNVNEHAFDRKLRYKEYRIEWHDSMPNVDWETQDECVQHEDFDQELVRAAKQAGYAGTMLVHLHDRDGLDSFEYELDVA